MDYTYSPKTVARTLKVRRCMLEMTQDELADASGVSTAAISKYESEAATPSLENALRISNALGCTPNDLCGIKTTCD